jgi:hypothetical protein
MNGLADHQDAPGLGIPAPPTAPSIIQIRKRLPNPNEPSSVSVATIDTPTGLKLNYSPA